MFNGNYHTFPAFVLAVMSEVINGDHNTDAPDAYDSSPNDPSKFYSHHADGRPASHTALREAWTQRITADFEAEHGTEQAASGTAAANWAALGENAEGSLAQARQRATSAHLAKLAKYRRDAVKDDKRTRRRIMAAIAKHTEPTKMTTWVRQFSDMCP